MSTEHDSAPSFTRKIARELELQSDTLLRIVDILGREVDGLESDLDEPAIRQELVAVYDAAEGAIGALARVITAGDKVHYELDRVTAADMINPDEATTDGVIDDEPPTREEVFEIIRRFTVVDQTRGTNMFSLEELRHRLAINGLYIEHDSELIELLSQAVPEINAFFGKSDKKFTLVKMDDYGDDVYAIAEIRSPKVQPAEPTHASQEKEEIDLDKPTEPDLLEPEIEPAAIAADESEVGNPELIASIIVILQNNGGDMLVADLKAELGLPNLNGQLDKAIAAACKEDIMHKKGRGGYKYIALGPKPRATGPATTDHKVKATPDKETGYQAEGLEASIVDIFLAPGRHYNKLMSAKEIAKELGSSTEEGLSLIKSALRNLVRAGILISATGPQTRSKSNNSKGNKTEIQKFGLPSQEVKDWLKATLEDRSLDEVLHDISQRSSV